MEGCWRSIKRYQRNSDLVVQKWFTVFVLVAHTRNFRIATERLGVARSSVSQTLRRL
ncbi:LysR family transcriptional regulator [Scandinavium goeteborgense]|uniref:helix-turn-helix domain-containing protein n=1 Tax=Scandinavium goeteborgense TaxID=1851514 RepID=UPI0031F31434